MGTNEGNELRQETVDEQELLPTSVNDITTWLQSCGDIGGDRWGGRGGGLTDTVAV